MSGTYPIIGPYREGGFILDTPLAPAPSGAHPLLVKWLRVGAATPQ